MKSSPCRDCKQRTAECHAKCKRYGQFEEEMKKVRQNRMSAKTNMSTMFRAKYFK